MDKYDPPNLELSVEQKALFDIFVGSNRTDIKELVTVSKVFHKL